MNLKELQAAFEKEIGKPAEPILRKKPEKDALPCPDPVPVPELVIDSRQRLSKKQIVFSAVKRGINAFIWSAAGIFAITREPVSALVGGGALALIGGGQKFAYEKLKADGKPAAAAAVNPVDSILKIIMIIFEIWKMECEMKRKKMLGG